jgi:3-methyladenine DNA glycosylase/8-oxoguanine DNA glycosylase
MNPFRGSHQTLRKLDRRIAGVIDEVGPVRIELDPRETVYQSLFRSILYQQLTGKAAATILGRVKALYPKRKFPKPEDILRTPPEAIRATGVSGAKLRALQDLSRRHHEGLIPSRAKMAGLEDEVVIETLSEIRGVGRWTAQMFLIFTLGRKDVLPEGDYGVRKGFAAIHRKNELPTPSELLEHGERWRPHRTSAAWYLWRALELERYR